MFPSGTFGFTKSEPRSLALVHPEHDEEEFQMKMRLLLTTAVSAILATTAFAQSPKDTTTSPSTQTQTPATTQKAPETSTSQTTPSSSMAPATGPSQAQTTPSTSSQPGGTSAPAQAQTNAPASSSNQAQQSPSSSQAQQAPATDSSRNQAQQAPAGSNTSAQQPAQNTAQQPAQSTTAQQPAQSTNPPSNTAQSSSTNVNASVNINDRQRTRVTESISRLNVQPLTNVNFSLSVGTAIPSDVRLQALPADVVEVVPQYRGYSFFMVRDEIVIVEPSSHKIVTVLQRSGGSTAAAPARTHSRVAVTDKDRDVVRKHFKSRPERQATGRAAQTTGSSAQVVIRRGERVPDTVVVEEFPETVYRDAPTLRDYRYIHRENRTYIVDPAERTVIDDFD
jgi:hypothetical protein